MTHPLHEYVARQLADRLRSKRCVVVWYDPRSEFTSFVHELVGGPRSPHTTTPISVAGVPARMAEYAGSFLELRAVVEPFVAGDEPEPVLVYVPGCERDRKASVLLELERAGECYEPQLKRLARNVLRQRYTDGVIDDMLAPERVTYDDLARAASDPAESPSLLKAVFPDATGSEAMLAAWLADTSHDRLIKDKEAQRELAKLVRARLGLELPEGTLAKSRTVTLRYVLAGEFRLDFSGAPPPLLDGVPVPETKEAEAAIRAVARRLRVSHAAEYPALADRIESELGFSSAALAPEALGSIDTFRFEERALLGHCAALTAAQRYREALVIAAEREQSFWLDRDVARKAQWEAMRRMAELGIAVADLSAALAKRGADVRAWFEAYSAVDGWHRADRAQRRLESWLATLEEEADERALGMVRRAYEDACHAMAVGFADALARAGWAIPGALHQTRIFSDVVAERMVAARPKPVAYFLVDAMRFEMGAELLERLPKAAEASLRPAVASLPSITPVGMAALHPGAAASYSVAESKGRLGARIEDAFLPDLTARRKFFASRVAETVDIALDDLLGMQASKLKGKVEGAQVIVVRSQEIDAAGEAGFGRQARRVMDEVIGDLASAVQRLARAGVEHSVITADHGHLFFPVDRDEAMRVEAPGGDQVDLHRRCWIGRGGSTPPGCVRVTAQELGYQSDLDFVFPAGAAIFKAGGDAAFHHGGPTLQELVIPVMTVFLSAPAAASRARPSPVEVTGVPDRITNRIFSVTMQLGLSLFSTAAAVRPILVAGGRQVGAAGMAIGGEIDQAGSIRIEPGKTVTVAFRLSDDTVTALRVVVQDPSTDAELYRSPADIPVQLGV